MLKKALGFSLLLMASACTSSELKPEVWILDNTAEIGGYEAEEIGNPTVVIEQNFTAVAFDGEGDGLLLPVNPLEGKSVFTIEVLFRPDADGPEEQRFVHFQDESENRGLIETRLDEDGNWALDTFLYNKSADNGLTLLDRQNYHPADTFYWVALVYDGNMMSHYVNGMKELEGQIDFDPMGSGKISLGMRMNQVHWFKGLIREIRFHPKALHSDELQRAESLIK
jgi:hypothetical protein